MFNEFASISAPFWVCGKNLEMRLMSPFIGDSLEKQAPKYIIDADNRSITLRRAGDVYMLEVAKRLDCPHGLVVGLDRGVTAATLIRIMYHRHCSTRNEGSREVVKHASETNEHVLFFEARSHG